MQSHKQRKLPSLLRKLQLPWQTRPKDGENDKNKYFQPHQTTPNFRRNEQSERSDTRSPEVLTFKLLETKVPVETNPTKQTKKQKRVRIPTFIRNKQIPFRKRKDKKGTTEQRNEFQSPTRVNFLLKEQTPSEPPLTSSEGEEDNNHHLQK